MDICPPIGPPIGRFTGGTVPADRLSTTKSELAPLPAVTALPALTVLPAVGLSLPVLLVVLLLAVLLLAVLLPSAP
jgi:hypothetical protein